MGFYFFIQRGKKKNPTELLEVMLFEAFVTGSMPQPVSLPALMSLSAASRNRWVYLRRNNNSYTHDFP